MDYIIITLGAIFALTSFFAFALIALFIKCDYAAEEEARKRLYEKQTNH
jgi:hypothetical protein